jgi:hypothetical protein
MSDRMFVWGEADRRSRSRFPGADNTEYTRILLVAWAGLHSAVGYGAASNDKMGEEGSPVQRKRKGTSEDCKEGLPALLEVAARAKNNVVFSNKWAFSNGIAPRFIKPLPTSPIPAPAQSRSLAPAAML